MLSVSKGRFISVIVFLLAILSAAHSAAKPISKLKIENFIAIPDTDRTVRRTVSAKTGGVIAATGADGTRYMLTIPKNALIWDEEISLTPWMMASGLGGAPIIGFDVGPSGTRLVTPATVIIEPKGNAFVGKARKNVTFFETQGTGQVEARIALPADAKSFGLRLFHFSGGGQVAHVGEIREYFRTDGSGVTPDFVSREQRSGASTEQIMEYLKDWQRQIVQDRDAGTIDGIKAEGQLATTERLMNEAAGYLLDKKVHEVGKKLGENETGAKMAEIEADAIASRGDLSEVEDLGEKLGKVLDVERQHQILGMKEGQLDKTVVAIIE